MLACCTGGLPLCGRRRRQHVASHRDPGIHHQLRESRRKRRSLKLARRYWTVVKKKDLLAHLLYQLRDLEQATKSLQTSVPHLQNGNDHSTHLLGLSWGLKELIYGKGLELGLARSKCSLGLAVVIIPVVITIEASISQIQAKDLIGHSWASELPSAQGAGVGRSTRGSPQKEWGPYHKKGVRELGHLKHWWLPGCLPLLQRASNPLTLWGKYLHMHSGS